MVITYIKHFLQSNQGTYNLLFAIMLYFPLILADKLGSEGTEEKAMLFKYSFYRSLVGVAVGGIISLILINMF